MNEDVRRECLFKEVKVIQGVIERMARNSFMIKGWTVTLVVGTLILKGAWYQAMIAYIPLLAFWALDAYFLWQERLYRKLYNWVIENRLQTEEFLFDMNAYRFREQVDSVVQVMFSITLFWFYGWIGLLLTIYLGLSAVSAVFTCAGW